jgi:hypothetical protein
LRLESFLVERLKPVYAGKVDNGPDAVADIVERANSNWNRRRDAVDARVPQVSGRR